MKYVKFSLGLAALLLAGSASAANRPSGYVTICTEGKTCAVTSSTNVAFGRADKFFYKTLVGSFVCNEATFGGRVAGGTNECSVPSGTSTSSVSSSKSSSSVASSSSSVASSSSSKSSSSVASSVSSVPANSCTPGSVITNTTVDCGGITVGTSCNGGSESQLPLFTLNNATIRNVRLNANAADGIHCVSGNCRIENVVWEDVCEDAATNKSEGGTLTISGGSANAAEDKTFQHNSKNSTTVIENFNTYGQIGKLWRSCGDCSNNGGPRYVSVNNVTINGTVTSTVVAVNRNYGDKATIRNLKVKGLTRPTAITTKPRICEEWLGVEKGGSTVKYGEFFNTQYCDVSPSDVSSF
ncbi:pectate lyase [Viridibacterium curvum]|uniref:Pectate lyase n=1 Tax=Viridibacterium curvum TaxID=1101404 RepID=A0ABP9Q5Y9_9RHOO